MKKVALHNLGCKVNAYETEAMQQQLEERGYEIVPFDQKADVYIINTCSVTNIADRKSRQMLHLAKKLNPEAVVVAAGCYVQVASDALKEDDSVDIIVGNNNKARLADILEEYMKDRQGDEGGYVLDIARAREYEELHVSRLGEHTRAFIKVQDGCNQFCSYCIIPYARGRVRSRKPEDVEAEVKGLVARGYREVVLTGIHLSSYGTEHMEGSPVKGGDWDSGPLWDLIERIHRVEGLERIRFMTSHPKDLSDELIEVMAKSKKICRHLHLPLQSGSSRILKAMNRRYTKEQYLALAEKIKTAIPDISLTTDIIVGFPGETEEDFQETLDVVRKVRFDSAFTFIYSKRTGTPAAAMENQVPEDVVKNRFDRLLKEVQDISAEVCGRDVHTVQTVLVEEVNDHSPELVTGRMSNNTIVHFPGDASLIGKLVDVYLEESKGFYYMGRLNQ